MRAITKDAVKAFLNSQRFKRDNTEVSVCEFDDTKYMYLHGNCIAKVVNGKMSISCGGWTSLTTKERLNGLLEWLNLPTIRQIKGVWKFTDGKPFDTEGWNFIK